MIMALIRAYFIGCLLKYVVIYDNIKMRYRLKFVLIWNNFNVLENFIV